MTSKKAEKILELFTIMAEIGESIHKRIINMDNNIAEMLELMKHDIKEG